MSAQNQQQETIKKNIGIGVKQTVNTCSNSTVKAL